MDVTTIRSMKKDLMKYLSELDDCFCRRGSRHGLRTYVGGQLWDLPNLRQSPESQTMKKTGMDDNRNSAVHALGQNLSKRRANPQK